MPMIPLDPDVIREIVRTQMSDRKQFGERALEAVEESVIAFLHKGDWFALDYATRVKIDLGFTREIFAAINMSRVKALVAERVEERIADNIFNAMATEIATDVKQIVSNKELREDVRALIRQKIRESVAAVSK